MKKIYDWKEPFFLYYKKYKVLCIFVCICVQNKHILKSYKEKLNIVNNVHYRFTISEAPFNLSSKRPSVRSYKTLSFKQDNNQMLNLQKADAHLEISEVP